MKRIKSLLTFLLVVGTVLACSKKREPEVQVIDEGNKNGQSGYDTSGLLYPSYTGLVMAGYQGWFAAEGDGSNRGWYHYQGNGGFYPGNTNVDFWPDITEYTKTYKSPFKFADGSDAYLYSPYDYESVDLHFKWMKDYGIDGVHMQRFVGEIKASNPSGKRHFNKVLENALKAAKKYGRAISVMYDLSGCSSADVAYLEQDWNELVNTFKLYDKTENPTYLWHNKKPLMTIWGVGFNDNRNYSIQDVDKLVDKLKAGQKQVSIMLGVPYYWRTFGSDTENNPLLHTLIKKVDIVMPWAVGRYGPDSYNPNNLRQDMQWCNTNKVDYVPLIFPGFSWGNMHKDPTIYYSIPRNKGDFLWTQAAGAIQFGAKSLYVAMFDEIDEGTAIFKCARESETPLNGNAGLKFAGIENDLPSDHYLWLTGQAANWLHGEKGYTYKKPERTP
ncbi:xylosidase [Pedobacter sp. BS3]|uniref:glycoside hydrolase family 71/99-like protein n=1 Tax=Pedobacter sp. BS3 TaxID=2567937 RepID=UPI0011ED7916|nr:glycoside hydrolase family 71/99-like protein [Pedobacter sp. BS3]TZF85026.1 xylosidase [Pedobacter sp. BS3]